MKNAKVACDACGKPISSATDLVVVSEFKHFPLAAYHNNCYAGQLKKSLWTYGGTKPLNGRPGTLSTGITAVFALGFAILVGWLYKTTGIQALLWPALLLGGWAAFTVGVRYWVYKKYEQLLPK